MPARKFRGKLSSTGLWINLSLLPSNRSVPPNYSLIHDKKHTLDFDPWTIFDELIPYVNQQIDEVEMELKIRGLPFIPSDYRMEITKNQRNHKNTTAN